MDAAVRMIPKSQPVSTDLYIVPYFFLRYRFVFIFRARISSGSFHSSMFDFRFITLISLPGLGCVYPALVECME